jgi:hypothetical protein
VIHEHITHPPNGANITEWCKKEECWKGVAELRSSTAPGLAAELIPIDRMDVAVDRGVQSLSDSERKLITEVAAVPSDVWFRISKWAKETGNLQGWQRSIAYSLGKIVANGREPSIKQAVQGAKILVEAERLGCDVSARRNAASS